jgi:tellurite resistance protein TerC
LIYTGYGLFKHWDEDPDPSENVMVRNIRKVIPFTDEYHGTKLTIKEAGKRYGTPMLLVMIAIGATDLLFALDSIPATFGVTQEPFLVFSANAFALLGLRALYFLLKGLLDKLVYLSLGLSVILIFIGMKLILLYAHEVNETIPKISTSISLVVIAAILVISTVASFIKVRKDPTARAHAGRITDAPKDTDN